MKKGLSILTAFMLVTAMLHISVARHYCGGELAASKISLTGSLAGCGMEGTEGSCPRDYHRDQLESHCCEDVVTYYSLDNFFAQSQTLTVEPYKYNIQVLELPFTVPVKFHNFSSHFFTDLSPPDFPMCSAVYLTEICIFRI